MFRQSRLCELAKLVGASIRSLPLPVPYFVTRALNAKLNQYLKSRIYSPPQPLCYIGRQFSNVSRLNPAMLNGSHLRIRMLRTLCLSVFFAASLIHTQTAAAQVAGPVLISHEDSTRAISFESVTEHREPFSVTSPVRFGTDNQTRIMLFVMNLSLQSGDDVGAITVEAEDAAHHVYQLPVEFLGSVPDQPWASSLVVRVSSAMDDVGDVLVRVSYRGVSSNRVRLAMGHVGGGLPDDPGAWPTPGS